MGLMVDTNVEAIISGVACWTLRSLPHAFMPRGRKELREGTFLNPEAAG